MYIPETIENCAGLNFGELVSKIPRELSQTVTLEHLICLPGLALLACWLLKTSLGRNALADSVPRRNNMPFYTPFIPLLMWSWSVSLGNWLIGKWIIPPVADLSSATNQQLPFNHWQSAFFDNLVLGICEIITIIIMILMAKAVFTRKIKGFGLNVKTIPKDFLAAVVNLLTVWPLVVAMVILTLAVGQFIWGQDFQIQRHEQLVTITAYPQLPLRILVVITAVVIASVFEEMLFRGLFQTMLRSYLENSKWCASGPIWLSILISSALFASVHQVGHWPALFVLAICLGYAYEKSGSLFRPIFIHALFNAVTIAAALNASTW
jgi:membrane protease YdiL (CAAX protease family)